MKDTGSMGKTGRRCNFIIFCSFFFLPLPLVLLLFSILINLFGFQVASVVRNRSTEMVEALYNMNRVHE